MQIDLRYHPTFIDARGPDETPLWQDPAFNILYAARLLHENLRKLGGDVPMAIASYNASMSRVRWAIDDKAKKSTNPEVRIAALDSITTGGDYVSFVLNARASYLVDPKETPNV